MKSENKNVVFHDVVSVLLKNLRECWGRILKLKKVFPFIMKFGVLKLE